MNHTLRVIGENILIIALIVIDESIITMDQTLERRILDMEDDNIHSL